ncbi:EpsG family protein [Pseudomonas sp. URMO17WK12:I12]|jgi:hypothetical protein|uniref:EpsG family protein n=1 Tax=Pseudomonas sp. URMO17WK12:I12 TaxID=1259797 RepID=UPI00048217ED|nr:EpsG family protein [Pseudomonas sp. URMO17WK12:I12]
MWILVLLVLAVLIAFRPSDLASDYTVYEANFLTIISGGEVSVELGYRVFSLLSETLGFGFVGLLFIYAFITLYYKFRFLISLDELTAANTCFFVILYGIAFFPLWELTQIRNAAAVAVSCVAIVNHKAQKSIVLFLFAALLHNVAIIIFIMWAVFRYFYTLRFVVVCAAAVVLYFIIEFMPYFSTYSLDVYLQAYNPFSFKVLFILVTFIFVYFHKQQVAKKIGFYAFAFLALYLSMGQMPAAAVRIVDIALFFSVVSLALTQGQFTAIYKLLTVVSLGYVYLNLAFFAEPPLLNIQSLLN